MPLRNHQSPQCFRSLARLVRPRHAPKGCAPLRVALEAGATSGDRVASMVDKRLIDELNERIGRVLQGSPVADVEKNVRAVLGGWFDRLQLVPREDFDVQRRLLERAQAKLAELEKRISDLETRRPPQPPHK